MDLPGGQRAKYPSTFDTIFDFCSDKRRIKLDFARAHSSRWKISFAAVWWDSQESLDIACLSRKTHGFDKKDCVGRGEAVPGIPLEKKMDRGRREGNKSEKRRREFMFRTHGNLWTANWRGGIGSEVKRWEIEMERGVRGRGYICRNF